MPSHNPPNGLAVDILNRLRDTLLSLHKTLLDSERAAYERDIAPVESPGQMLGLLMSDPWFAYLREISRLVVRIDEIIDSKEESPSMDHANQILGEARELLKPAENGAGFEKRYYEALQRDPNVVLAHAAAGKVLAALRAE